MKQIAATLLVVLTSAAFVPQQDSPELRRVMALHRMAVGGVDALINFETARLTYEVILDGEPAGSMEAWYGPDTFYREIVREGGRTNSVSFDGSYAYRINASTGYARSPHGPDGNGEDAYIYNTVRSSALIFPLMWAERFGAEISLDGEGTDGYTVRALYPDNAVRVFRTDLSARLQRDVLRFNRTGVKLVIEREYEDYRNRGGAVLPGVIRMAVSGSLTVNGAERTFRQDRVLRLTDVEGNVDIPPGFFTPGFPVRHIPGRELSAGSAAFRFGGEVPVGDDPESIRAGDLNEDGVPDLVTGDDGTVSLLAGDGHGGFPIRLNLPAGGGSNEYALPVDLDGDGRLDMTVASTALPPSTLFLSLNLGEARFGEPRAVETGDYPESIAAADFDGDGLVDLAVAHNRSGDARVHYGDGTGGISRTLVLHLGGNGENVAVADLNGDGLPDLLAVDQQCLTVFINEGGEFAEGTAYEAGPFPFCVTAADFTGDGNVDVLVGNGGIFRDCGERDVAMLTGRGDGTLAPASFTSAGGSITCIEAADLDGDGDVDAAASSFGTHEAWILINRDGELAAAAPLPCSWSPAALCIADLNGDGKADIAVANEYGDNVSLWFGAGK